MTKLQEKVPLQQKAQPQGIPVETLLRPSFRLTLIGLALLFVTAIYYGLINP